MSRMSRMWTALFIVAVVLENWVLNTVAVDENGGRHLLENKVESECIGCGYTPDAPAPVNGEDIPRCTDVLCLVQGLLEKKSLIYVERDIDLSGAGPLPDITSEVTIMGACIDGTPCRIDAKGTSQIFVVGLNGYLTLKDLEITGGSCTRGGACTISGSGSNKAGKGGKFVAHNVKFTNNTASEYGAALNVESGGSVYIRDSVFQGNKASMGGAVFVGSSKHFPASDDGSEGVTCAINSCTSFSNTEFVQNSAGFGGAVYVDDAQEACKENGGAKFDCLTCSFHENSAQDDGGAVFVNYQSSGGIANFQKSRFSRNFAGGYGGDVATQQGQYGTRGAQFYAYEVVFSSRSKSSKGNTVAVKPFSFATFAKCDFSGGHFDTSVLCEGSCDTFCPVASPLVDSSSEGYGPSGESCPVAPSPLCDWVPAECQGSPAASLPPPSSSPPPAESSPPPPSTTESSSPPPPTESAPPAESTPPPPPTESSPPPPAVESPPFRSVRGKSRSRNGSITGDPHFVGKHGERFDFHGKSGRDYCIVSDEDFHVNMRVFRGLHRRTTFISKIGILFKGDRILVEAQANKRALLFDDQWKILVNNVELPNEQAKKTESGLRVAHLPHSVHVRVLGELDVNITVRPASFGRTGSGANYLDFQINQLKVTPKVHGVLGQTYQETLSTYQKISAAKNRRVKRSRAASFFVDGSESDYLSSGIMLADCKYSAFMNLSNKVQRMMLEGAKSTSTSAETVEQCTGFGHSLCLLE